MSVGWRLTPVGFFRPLFSRLAIFQQRYQYKNKKFPTSQRPQLVSQPGHRFSCFSTMTESTPLYHPESDVEDLEGYRPGGYHPTLIGDTFCDGRYTVVHKLGSGGYSTIWLARDQQLQHYVSLKILVAGASQDTHESEILQLLSKSNLNCPGKQFIPTLLHQFSFDGPNGHHQCLVGVPTGCSVASSKENSTNFMFPPDAARSLAAQLIMGLAYLHSNDVCHGDLHLHNFLLRAPSFNHLSTTELYEHHSKLYEVPVRRLDGKPTAPHAPPRATYPMIWRMPANKVADPEILISDYGTSFIASQTPSPTLHTPALYAPPEEFFNKPIAIPKAADIWTLGVVLYDAVGECPLFETFAWDPDDIIAEMVNTLGDMPARWWAAWANRSEFFNPDGSWISNFQRISTPEFRRLHQRMWDMGRGETPETCQWDVAAGEFKALEDMLRSMMTFEPAERPTAKQLLESEYIVKWAMPAWERQVERKSALTKH
ncbi:CMGC/SRPK protein kinase [Coccidioides immitis RS]|uniref:non-specific serine/threonine protein kinase n=1 Tax=Coccidioides immitis (strain RS) TaxID=246410 RepID=J3KKG6_COCIM|nr:CMGC/SRPK protein kinase [Coccidioides immitis RS]EAS36666.3 CMGC/SRPK protein kinase [Coccidioides immitis RS]